MSIPAAQPPALLGRPVRRLEIDGTHLAYVECGDADAEVVLLLHGYMGSHLVWRHLIDPLAAAHRVIAPDWFGWGRSGRRLDLRYDYDTEVDRLRRVLDALDIEACTLVGHDYGGYLGLGLCQRHPERVRRLALVNSRAHRTFNRKWARTFSLISLAGRLPVVRGACARLPWTALHVRGARRELRKGIYDRASLEDYTAWMSGAPDGGRFLMRFMAEYRVGERRDLAAGLGGIACPAAVIWGARDAFLDTHIAEELARGIPGAALTLIPDAGHFLPEERPDDVLSAVQALLARAAE